MLDFLRLVVLDCYFLEKNAKLVEYYLKPWGLAYSNDLDTFENENQNECLGNLIY